MKILDKLFPWKCTPVLPTIYNDSLSYMEMLCKLVKTVDDLSKHVSIFESEIIDQISALADRINNLDPTGESNAVLYTPQTLTSEQKTQARANIDAGGVYIFEIGGITPNGERVTFDPTKYEEISAAVNGGVPVIAKINVESFPGFQEFHVPIFLPLTLDVGRNNYIFTGIVSPRLQSIAVDTIYDSWIGVFDVTPSTAGFSILKITDVTEPPTVSRSITKDSEAVSLSGAWEIVVQPDSGGAGDVNFVNKAGLTVVKVNASSGKGKTYIAKAVDGVINSSGQSTIYTPSSASDGDNKIVGFKWSGNLNLNYTLKR